MRSGTALLVAALCASGCAQQGPSAAEPPGPPPGPAAAQGRLPPGFPAAFPLPPGHTLVHAGAGLTECALTLRVPSAADALAFYREALPRAGYEAREGTLRPRGAADAGPEVRFIGGLVFTLGRGDAQSDPGSVEALADADGERLEITVPRVGVPPSPGDPPRTQRPRKPVPPPGAPQPPGPGAYAALTLPRPFPWPPRYKNASFARTGDGVLTGRLDVPAGPGTYDFYQAALVDAGYRVNQVWRPDERAEVFLGRLAFDGHGQSGRLTVASDPTSARLTIRFAGGGH
jgi:hypothetical protein